ncbi:exodeoxyribonuclease V subunit beta [Alteromonas sp. ASW11-36]|uniref:RecBCD enzyme subunit RecB n=1 Tax=Alteromonas arenosi TaxID=3055817 RepID=A0ABT7SWB4_9ALTE|nr:exodeoxyribonuclease V subunit beta [Alteromonas sp. ASW11-36]MDM7860481.1 exodeoxyribonuclease V subunit beta [Alteromonas sp. ASW11-36]
MGKPTPLDVNAMILSGSHLIEASAGTGKTYNITRIYLRLVIERGLSVTQILVMTFTNAATQELRGRLADTLQEALHYWQNPTYRQTNNDAVMANLHANCDQQEAVKRIKLALLELDEAAVFTLHGFSYRVLTEMAFAAGKPMSETLAHNHEPLYLQALQDWFRIHRNNNELMASLGSHGCYTPESFWHSFKSLIYTDESVKVFTEKEITTDFDNNMRALLNEHEADLNEATSQLLAHKTMIFAELIEGHKQQSAREDEWQVLLDWLASPNLLEPPKAVSAFLHGNRYSRKDSVKEVLKPVSELRKKLTDEARKLDKTRKDLLAEIDQWHVVLPIVEWVKRHVSAEKRRLREVGFDDLIKNLAVATSQSRSFALQIRHEFPVALIDEFQDTDSLQYQILSNIYRTSTDLVSDSEPPLLMMIGDPKQAIYGFRGGDIFTYLLARDDADYQWVMDTNWRSVAGMVTAYNRLFWGTDLSAEARDVFGYSIAYEQVKSTPYASAAKQRFVDPLADSRQPLTFFAASTPDSELSSADKKRASQRELTHWCVAEIRRLLNQVRVDDKPLKPADIAILVRTGREAQRISEALRSVNLSAVYLSDKSSLFTSAEALELSRVLTGIWFYQQDRHAVRAASSHLFSLSQRCLLAMQQDPQHTSWSEVRAQLAAYREQWLKHGCLSVITDLLCTRFSAGYEQERAITNYMHLAEMLQQASQTNSHPLQLLEWLKEQIADPAATEEYQQRLESDADLIKIVTQHKSKGLEYPVVFVPYANEYRDPVKVGNSYSSIYHYFCPEQDCRVLQLGRTDHAVEHTRKQGHAENMRLLYVAITRAAQRCYLGVAESDDCELSALDAALYESESSHSLPWYERLRAAVASCQYWSLCSTRLDTEAGEQLATSVKPLQLTAKVFSGHIDSDWRLHSFSGLTKDSHNTDISSREIEVFYSQSDAMSSAAANSQACAMPFEDSRFSFLKGAMAGNFLHDVLEHMDFSQPQLTDLVERFNRQYSVVQTQQQQAQLIKWLEQVLAAPINVSSSERVSLSNFSMQHTLREAEFYFPLERVNTDTVTHCLLRHRQQLQGIGLLESDDINAELHLSSKVLSGMMHGFIDLIFCHRGKYFVADYKSNHLGDAIADYTPKSLAQNNLLHNYDLQYLIYSVALHRYLAARINNYNFTQHFGGVCYLYLRGMHAENQASEGVFFQSLEQSLIRDLDQCFANVEDEAQK